MSGHGSLMVFGKWPFWFFLLCIPPSSVVVCKDGPLITPNATGRPSAYIAYVVAIGFLRCLSGKEPTCQCRRHKRCGFYPSVGKIPWSRTHSSVLAWKIPWIEEPGGLQEFLRNSHAVTSWVDLGGKREGKAGVFTCSFTSYVRVRPQIKCLRTKTLKFTSPKLSKN